MLLREMTSSAFAHSFKRFAQCVVVGLALAGLAACGGGGGGGSASPAPTTPEIPITPAPTDLPAPTADQLAAATVISAGETVTASLESADDVKYYKLDVTERRMIEFTLDADEGIEIAILDSNGNVITTAETASEVMTRVQAPEGSLYVRVRDKLKKGWEALNENKGTKALRLTFKVLGVAENIYNLIRGIPRVNLTIAGRGVIIDLRDYVRVSDGRTVTWTVEIIGGQGIGGTVEGTTVTLQASGEAVSGGFIWRLKAYDPVVAATSIELIEGTVARRLPTLSDVPCDRIVETTCIHDESIAPGGTYRSRNVEDYFDYPAGTDIDFRQAATMTPRVEGWTHRIVDGKLVVTVPSDPDADIYPDNLLIYLSAVDPDGGYARRMFSFTIGEEPAPQGSGSGNGRILACVSPELSRGSVVSTGSCDEKTIVADPSSPIGLQTEQAAYDFWARHCTTHTPRGVPTPTGKTVAHQCPREGAPLITICRDRETPGFGSIRSQSDYAYYPLSLVRGLSLSEPPFSDIRDSCSRSGGTFEVIDTR